MPRFAFLLFCALALSLRAHPEIDEALARLDALIATTPDSAEHFLTRGELHARHNNWIAAHADFQVATRLSPDLPRLDCARGALALARGRPAEARVLLNRALQLAPADAEALVLRSRAHAALDDRNSALADLNAALARMAAPSPDLFLTRASLFVQPTDAIHSLNEGIERVGPVPSLIVRALVLEESAGRIDDAVNRINRITAGVERRESWLKLRGDILLRAGRNQAARDSYAEARAAITALPAWLRVSPATVDLASELDQLLASGSSSPK